MTTGLTRALTMISKPKPSESSERPGPQGPDLGGDRRSDGADFAARHGFGPTERVTAVPIMGQPAPAAPAVVIPKDSTNIDLASAKTILTGLQETLRLVDGAGTTGWTCGGVDQTTFYQGRILRDRLAAFVAAAKTGDMFEISTAEVDAADKILGCSNEATGVGPNKSAYIALGVIVASAAIFLSLT
jgi:hypothetical protein